MIAMKYIIKFIVLCINIIALFMLSFKQVVSSTERSKVTSIELPNKRIIRISSPPYQHGENKYDRTLLSTRVERRLPGTKGSPSPAPVDCSGTWSPWSDCVNGKKSRTFKIDTNPAHGGSSCPSSPETIVCQMPTTTTPSPMPIDCKGVWGAWSKCTNGIESRYFYIDTNPAHGGVACPSSPETRECQMPTTTRAPVSLVQLGNPNVPSSGGSAGCWLQILQQPIMHEKICLYQVAIHLNQGTMFTNPPNAFELRVYDIDTSTKAATLKRQLDLIVDVTNQDEQIITLDSCLMAYYGEYIGLANTEGAMRVTVVSGGTPSWKYWNKFEPTPKAIGSMFTLDNYFGPGSLGWRVDGYSSTENIPFSQPLLYSTTTSAPLIPTNTITIDWDYMVPKGETWNNVTEMPLIHCEIGQTVEFVWKHSNSMHDIYELYGYESYMGCDFNSKGAVRRSIGHSNNSFTFQCNSMGTRFFACSIDDACERGKQRVRIHGIDSRKTQSIRENGGHTLAEYMKESVVSYKNGDTIVAEAKAMQLENMLLSIESNSPKSCSDWLIPGHLSNDTCLGYVYTDLGVLFRQRAESDLEQAEMYYNKALEKVPNFCLAESYLVELKIKANNKAAADYQFKKACDACGPLNLDMELIRMAYKRKGWSQPQDSKCRDDEGGDGSCWNGACCASGTEYVDGKCQVVFKGMLHAQELGFIVENLADTDCS